MRVRLADANSGRYAAERMAARMVTEVQDLRTCAVAAETGRLKVSSKALANDPCTPQSQPYTMLPLGCDRSPVCCCKNTAAQINYQSTCAA